MRVLSEVTISARGYDPLLFARSPIRKIARVIIITISKRILISDNKRIHIISAYFLAAANDKHMHLLTSLYGRHIREVEGCEITPELIVNSHCCKDPESILPEELILQVFQHAQIESKSSLIS